MTHETAERVDLEIVHFKHGTAQLGIVMETQIYVPWKKKILFFSQILTEPIRSASDTA